MKGWNLGLAECGEAVGKVEGRQIGVEGEEAMRVKPEG